jgi:hypothetical protein
MNVTKQSKKAGKPHPTESQMVAYCVEAFRDYLAADKTLQDAKALWDAARVGLRTELGRAYKVIAHGKAWDRFLAAVRAGLVKAKVCGTPKDAGRLIRNQLIALSITGNGVNGKRKTGGGRKEKTAAVVAKLSEKDVQRILLKALNWAAAMQKKYAPIDNGVLEDLGDLAAILANK